MASSWSGVRSRAGTRPRRLPMMRRPEVPRPRRAPEPGECARSHSAPAAATPAAGIVQAVAQQEWLDEQQQRHLARLAGGDRAAAAHPGRPAAARRRAHPRRLRRAGDAVGGPGPQPADERPGPHGQPVAEPAVAHRGAAGGARLGAPGAGHRGPAGQPRRAHRRRLGRRPAGGARARRRRPRGAVRRARRRSRPRRWATRCAPSSSGWTPTRTPAGPPRPADPEAFPPGRRCGR